MKRLAGLVLAMLLLGGCPVAPVAVDETPPPRPRAPRPSPSIGPTDVELPVTRTETAVRGTLYNAKGQSVSKDLAVQVTSRGAKAFDRTIDVFQGRYIVTDVPVRTELNFRVLRRGVEIISRDYQQIRSVNDRTVVNFGGPASEDDPEAPLYAVPEEAPATAP